MHSSLQLVYSRLKAGPFQKHWLVPQANKYHLPPWKNDRMGLFEFDRTAVSVCDLGKEGNDLAFWLSRTPLERLEAVEYLRQLAYGYDPATASMERILEVDDLK